MPRTETVKVNEALADPEAKPFNPVEDRYQEVVNLGWMVTSEMTDYGRYRRDRVRSGWIIPTRDEETSERRERVVSLADDTGFDTPLTEVTLFQADPDHVRSFLVQSDERNPHTKQFDRRLVIFRAPIET